jgi:hypothetical protein
VLRASPHDRALRRRAVLPLLLALLATALASPAARGDADPASDVLLYQDIFYPYQPVVSAGPKAQLDALTAAAHKAGFPIKVAIIGSQSDLGAVSSFISDPRGYASFLDHEIQTSGPQPLLVVMPAGVATASVGAKAAASLRGTPSLADEETDGLVRAAIAAVRRMAAAEGHSLPLPPAPARSGSGSSHAKRSSSGGGVPLGLVLVPVALLALAALALLLRRRRGRSPLNRGA